LAALLAVDHYSTYPEQFGLGVLTWGVLFAALTRFPVERRAQALGVVVFATIGEVTGSLIWGVYHYRLHNLPLFVPPAHGIVYLTGLSLSGALSRHARALVVFAAAGAATWGAARADGAAASRRRRRRRRAAAAPVPLALAEPRGLRRGVRVVASLELYGTAIGTWHWARTLPGLGIADGNPPSGVASGYVWFDVMALLVAPYLVALTRRFGPVRTPDAASDDFRPTAESLRATRRFPTERRAP
jgi:hypothetical protein